MLEIFIEQLKEIVQQNGYDRVIFIIFKDIIYANNYKILKKIKEIINENIDCDISLYCDYCHTNHSKIIIWAPYMNFQHLYYNNIIFIDAKLNVNYIKKEFEPCFFRSFEKINPIYLIDIIRKYDLLKIEEIKYRFDFFRKYFIKDEYAYWQIQNDQMVLKKENILTTRLSKTIYKSSTFNFMANDRIIGDYYRDIIGIKSKTKRIPIYYKIKNGKTVKESLRAYDLNESPLFKHQYQY